MANISIGPYELDISIPAFRGLYQDGDQTNVDASHALFTTGVDTAGGVLKTAARHKRLLPELPAPIDTLMALHRRYHADTVSADVLVASSAGRLYWMLPASEAWTEIAHPAGVPPFASGRWSWLNYEINPEGSDAPVDVLLISNALDGMFCVRGDDMTCEAVPTPKRFGVIARYAERIWGGAIASDPDMLVYSAPFDPFDWAQNSEIPEDGAGDILQPSWDGDRFVAMLQFGSQLIAFKHNRVWRILGTDPGQYLFKEQYGGGARYFNTVAAVNERILTLGREGVDQYDGYSMSPYYHQYARGVFERMNQDALEKATACFYRNRYYCAMPLDRATENSAVLVYNTEEKTWLLHEHVTVTDFLPTDDGLFFTSATVPGLVMRWGEDAWADGAGIAKWVSPWLDFQKKDCRYGGFSVYLAVQCRAPVDLTVTVRTEKKAKTKTYRAQPQPAEGAGPKHKRINFGGAGRRFQIEISSADGNPWAIVGGIQIKAERDVD